MVYDASGAPHQMEELDGTVLWAGSYDANGNRTVRTLGGQWEHGYTFDLEDRLSEILILPNGGSGRRVAMHYDEGGQQKARVVKSWAGVTERVTKYYAPVIEVSSDGSVDTTVKSYFFGGQRVASRIDDGAAWQFSPLASISLPNPVQLASQWMGDSPVLVVKLTGGASAVTAAAIALLFVTLFVMPPGRRRRAVVGIRLTRGAALGLTILFVVGTIPLPVLIQPAEACSGCDCPTPVPVDPEDVRYYHYDHLGSPLMITDAAGAVSEQIRYHPYGEVRGRYDANDNPIGEPGEDDIRYEFTGYEAERASGLLYANARFYDPAVGTFLTHDPAAQFWSPYTYTGWDPVNIVDPSGALGVVAGIVLAFSIGFLVGFGQALENGASFGDALVAGVISGGIAAVSAAVLGPVSNWVNAAAAKGAYLVAIAFYGLSGGAAVYGTVTSFQNGQNVAGVAGAVGIVLLAIGAYGAYGKYKAYVAAQPSDVSHSNAVAREGTDLALVKGRYDRETGELVVKDVDTGIKIRTTAESGGKPWGDPIEPGTYEILDQARNPDFFRLDPVDAQPRNDVHELTGRTNFRLHGPGRTIGCIACTNRQQWIQLRSLIDSTSTVTVPDKGAPWWRQILTGQEPIRKFGTLKVK